MDKQILFTGINKAEFVDAKPQEMGPDQIRVKTCISTISNGTEKANITGNTRITVDVKCPDKPVFPRVAGYSTSGIIVEKGENVKNLEIGDRVAMYWTTHRSYNVIDQNQAIKLPDEVSFEEAAIAHIACFPLAAIRKTKLEIGESAIVMGLGTLGLIAVSLLRAAGAVPVIAIDPVEERRQKALEYGADYALNPFDEDFAAKVKSITGGGAKVAIEVTGNGAGLNEALDCMARFGRVALLGCTRESDFTVDYYTKVHGPGISLIGAHTLARPNKESYPGYFTTYDDMKTIIKLCQTNRIDLKSMIEETHSPKECTEVFQRLINDKNFPCVVQFNWTEA